MVRAGAEQRQTAIGAARRIALALMLAYVLVLQALLGGLATGAHAGTLLDADAAPMICRGAGGDELPADPAQHTPDCCTFGCPTVSGSALTPPAAAVPAASGFAVVLRQAPPPERIALPADGRLAHPPRAPPIA